MFEREIPQVLTIAGSDSGGGAGIQADIKTIAVLGCHPLVAVTALTAQNTLGVTAVHPVPPGFLLEQVRAVATDFRISAAKTGMLANAELVKATAQAVQEFEIRNLVVDPVLLSRHGDPLLEPEAERALVDLVFPLARVVTPNAAEASRLSGVEVKDLPSMKEAARRLKEMGPGWVLVKGGHLPGDEAVDLLYDGAEFAVLAEGRVDTPHTHGTGCTLSSAIACFLARGETLPGAVRKAKAFVTGALRRALALGRGTGPVNQLWAFQPWDAG